MSDTKEEKVVTFQQPKGTPHLEQVKKDAERITLKRMKDQEEERLLKESEAKA